MPRSRLPRALRTARGFAGTATALVLTIGGLVLVGWAFDLPFLTRILPGLVSMKPNAALAFILAGLALYLGFVISPTPARQISAYLLAGLVAALGGLTLLEYLSGWDLGLDYLLFPGAVRLSDPSDLGRMGPATALAFLLTGSALLLLRVPHGLGLGQSAALLVGILGLLNAIGSLYGVPGFAGFVGYTPVALHTAVAFLLLSSSLLGLVPNRRMQAVVTSPTVGGLLARRLLPVVLVVPFLLGGLLLLSLRGGGLGLEWGIALFALSTTLIFTAVVGWTVGVLYRLETARHQAEQALRASHERFARAFRATPDALIISRLADNVILEVNERWEALFGYTRAEVIGRPSVALDLRWDPAERPALVAAFQEHGFVHDQETLIRQKSGDPRHVLLSIERLEIDGEPMALTIVRDISERKQAEAARLAQAAAEQASQAKNEFLSRMSHELRTPLNAILGFGELLERDALPPRAAEHVQQILKAGHYLLALINEVLDIARIEAGRLALSTEPVLLRDVLVESLELVRPSAAQHQIQLVTADLATATLYVLADHQRLKQVLLNLLNNAIKYNRVAGTVTIGWERRSEGRLRLTVGDTGRGIPAAALARLFTPFDRLGAEQTGVEGTGLGLALSQRLMAAMGGQLGVASTGAAGSTFWLDLPLAAAAPLPSVHAATPATRLAPVGGPARTVLLIDDNPTNLRLVERILELRPGVTLLAAQQGGQGLDLARVHQPDVILLDLQLPDLPGETVLRHLLADAATAGIPVVIFSADATPGQMARLLAAGAAAYLTKPFRLQTFLTLLDQMLQGVSPPADGPVP